MTNKGKKPRLVAENRYPKTGAAKNQPKKRDKTQKTPIAKKRGNLLHDLFLGSFVLLSRFCGVFFGGCLGHRHYAGHWHWLLHARSKAL